MTDTLPGPPPGLLGRGPRARIASLLDAALQPGIRLTLVSAPPGYGKSVAVASWVAARGLPCAWLALDPDDDDPAGLARRLLGALAGSRPGTEAVAGLIVPGSASAPRALARLVVDAIASDDREMVLVLDDAHVLASAASLQFAGALIETLPPFCHPLLVTRADPGLPIGRLRAHGALVEVRADDLRFTADEAVGLLAAAGLEAGPDVVGALVSRTEGWAAALQLAAITLRSAPDRAAAAGAFTGTQRFVIDYLADEVMAGLDEDLARTLSRLSIVDRFDAAVAGALAGPDAMRQVALAERANLFVVPLDAGRRWLRLHGLFADYLRSRLLAEERPGLHAAAAVALEAAGMRRDAVSHAVAAGDWSRAAALVRHEGRAAFEAGELATVRGWLATLPDEVRAADSDLVVLDAWTAFYEGRIAEAAAVAANRLAATAMRGEAEGRLLVLRALVGTTTDPGAESLAREGTALLAGDPRFLSLGLQAAGLARLGRGDIAGSTETLRRAFDQALAAGSAMAVLPAVNPLGHALEAGGRRDEAEVLARRVLDAYRGPDDAVPPIAWSAHLVLGIALYEGGDVAAARRELERGLSAAQAMGVGVPTLAWAVPHLALARQATGDVAGALDIVRPRTAAGGARLVLPSLAGETEARLRLAQGDVAAASRWADDAHAEAPEGSPLLAMLRLSADVTVARVRLAQGRTDEALARLGPAGSAYAAWGLVPDRISTLVLEAAAHSALGDVEAAAAALGEAVRLAEPGGYVSRFVDDGRGLLPLLQAVRAAAPAFAARVAEAIAAREADRAGRPDRPGRGTTVGIAADGELVESLTGRELEVLRVLATGVTNAELADRLGVSAGTAKWHVAHVLAKLSARSRTQAVVRGQRLGLL